MKTYRVSGSAFYEMPFVLEIEAESEDEAETEAILRVGDHDLHDMDGNRIKRDQTRHENLVIDFVEEVE